MKITLGQLKQLIREQLEEGAAPYGHSEPESGEDPAEREERIRRKEEERRRGEWDARDREEQASAARGRKIGDARRDAFLNAAHEREREQGVGQAGVDIANRIFVFLNNSKNLMKADAPKTIKLAGLTDANRQNVEFELNRRKLDSGENAGLVLRRLMKKGWKPSLFSSKPGVLGLGFMGLEEEIQQLVKEEIARQLRNKR